MRKRSRLPCPSLGLGNDRRSTSGSGDASLAIFITSVSGSESLASFTNRIFHFSGPPGLRMALAHLDSLPSNDLVLWSNGSVPFPFDKRGSGVLANCLRCGTEAILSVQVLPLKPAPFCTLFAGHGSINKSATSPI